MIQSRCPGSRCSALKVNRCPCESGSIAPTPTLCALGAVLGPLLLLWVKTLELFSTSRTCRGAVVGAGSLGTPVSGDESCPAGSAGQRVLVLSTQHRGDNWVKRGCPSCRLLHASGSCFPLLPSAGRSMSNPQECPGRSEQLMKAGGEMSKALSWAVLSLLQLPQAAVAVPAPGCPGSPSAAGCKSDLSLQLPWFSRVY